MRLKTYDFWNAWKGVILFALFQLIFHLLFWSAEKVGYESGNWDLLSLVGILFAFLVWAVPIVYGIMCKEKKFRSAAWFFILNTGVFLCIMFVVWYNVYMARGLYPTW